MAPPEVAGGRAGGRGRAAAAGRGGPRRGGERQRLLNGMCGCHARRRRHAQVSGFLPGAARCLVLPLRRPPPPRGMWRMPAGSTPPAVAPFSTRGGGSHWGVSPSWAVAWGPATAAAVARVRGRESSPGLPRAESAARRGWSRRARPRREGGRAALRWPGLWPAVPLAREQRSRVSGQPSLRLWGQSPARIRPPYLAAGWAEPFQSSLSFVRSEACCSVTCSHRWRA